MKKSRIKHLLTLLAVGLFLAFPVSVSAAEKEESQAVEAHTYTPSSGISTYSVGSYDYPYGYWRQSGSKWWFQYTDGSYASNGLYIIDGELYGFDAFGWMITGWYWCEDDYPLEGWYYFDSNGRAHHNWLYDSGNWYYFLADGRMIAGGVFPLDKDYLEDGKRTYYGFDASGKMLTGWQSFYDNWFYFTSSGEGYNGWLYDSGNWYYLEDGCMATGLTYIDETYYAFTPSGTMVTGWYWNEASGLGGWYYFDSSGAGHNGWVYDSGNWYYTDDGLMYHDGVYKVDGNYSVFAENGVWLGYY